MDASARPGPSRRTDYRAFHNLTTRWADNDVFGHVNNAAYYGFFDTAVIAWLFTRGLVGFATGPMGVVAETSCRFIGEVTFPETLAVGMRLSHVGRVPCAGNWRGFVRRRSMPLPRVTWCMCMWGDRIAGRRQCRR
jgi:hypothetical protein